MHYSTTSTTFIGPDGGNIKSRFDDIALADAAAMRNGLLRSGRGRKPLFPPMIQAPRPVLSKELLCCTLELTDIVGVIMSFISDIEFSENFENFIKSFRGLEMNGTILSQRRVIYCKTASQLELFRKCLQNVSTIKSELNISVPLFESKYTSMIEKFQTVDLNAISISHYQLAELINKHSKIQHLKFTNFEEFKDESNRRVLGRMLQVTPHLKKISFLRDCTKMKNFEDSFKTMDEYRKWKKQLEEENERRFNPIVEISNIVNFMDSNIDEIFFLSRMSSPDVQLLSHIGTKLTKLSILNQPLPKVWDTVNVPNLEHLWLENLPKYKVNTVNLHFANSYGKLTEDNDLKVKRITLDKGNITVSEIRYFLHSLLESYPNCEEVVLSESFFTHLLQSKQLDMNESESHQSLKKIVIKYSKDTHVSKYGCLKFVLQSIYPKRTYITTEEIEPHETFNVIPIDRESPNHHYDTLDDLFTRIESCEQHFKAMDNPLIKEKIKEIKRSFCSCMVSNNNYRNQLVMVEDSLNMLENLKKNKHVMLQTMNQGMENYFDIFTNDDLFHSASQQLDDCLSALEDEQYGEGELFSIAYSKLEQSFHKMIQVVEENRYPSKVLFNEQWFNEQIVEFYGEFGGVDVQMVEDCDEDMERACLEIDEMNEQLDCCEVLEEEFINGDIDLDFIENCQQQQQQTELSV